MPDLILQVWKLVLLGFIYLFFLRVMRAAWLLLRTPASPAPALSASPAASAQPVRTTEKGGGKAINALKIVEPKGQAGQIFDVEQELTIGRAPGCKVLIDDSFVSQLHARVFRRGNITLLEDLGSTNGTFCNGKRVTAPLTLKKGDRVQVGETVLEATR